MQKGRRSISVWAFEVLCLDLYNWLQKEQGLTEVQAKAIIEGSHMHDDVV